MIYRESITLTSPDCDSVGDAQSLSSPSGADQWEAQDGCWNGQQRLGVPLWESREMLCIESAGRRPQVAKPCLMDQKNRGSLLVVRGS